MRITGKSCLLISLFSAFLSFSFILQSRASRILSRRTGVPAVSAATVLANRGGVRRPAPGSRLPFKAQQQQRVATSRRQNLAVTRYQQRQLRFGRTAAGGQSKQQRGFGVTQQRRMNAGPASINSARFYDRQRAAVAGDFYAPSFNAPQRHAPSTSTAAGAAHQSLSANNAVSVGGGQHAGDIDSHLVKQIKIVAELNQVPPPLLQQRAAVEGSSTSNSRGGRGGFPSENNSNNPASNRMLLNGSSKCYCCCCERDEESVVVIIFCEY